MGETKGKKKSEIGIMKRGEYYYYRTYRRTGGVQDTKLYGKFATKGEAINARKKRLAELELEDFENIKKVSGKATLDQVYTDFIEKEAKFDRELSTIKRYDSLYRNHLKKNWGSKKVDDIKASEFSDYLLQLTTTHSQAYILSIHKFLKVLLTFAFDREYSTINVYTNINVPREDSSSSDKVKIYNKEELGKLDERFKSTNLYTSFLLGRHLGIRSAECFGLLWSDVNWEKRTISVTKQMVYEEGMWCLRNTKTKSAIRVINLQQDIYDYLLNLKVEQERRKEELGVAYKNTVVAQDNGRNKAKTLIENPDFINVRPNGEFLNTESVKVLSRIAKSELNIKFKFHNLRHTHASVLAELNIPAVVVKSRLGHAKIETTLKYYTHITESMTENLINKLDMVV